MEKYCNPLVVEESIICNANIQFDNNISKMYVLSSINVREYLRGNQKGQSRETGNIGYTRQRKTKQTQTQYALDISIRKQTQIT